VPEQGGWARITNYETLARDLDLINAWAPAVVIVDEAQRIKNWNTVAARALKRIASPYAIVLTGTPLQNRLEELVSIVQFVDQHRLGPTWRLLHEHQLRDESGRVVGYRNLDRIGTTLAPIMLRRRKAEVLDQLPERVDNTLFVPMTDAQLVHHTENGETVRRIVQRWRKTGFLSDVDRRLLTCALQNMRMSCDSTYLLDHETDHGTKADELMTLLEELFEQPDAKVVIFSQWVRTHELIARRLQSRGWGHVLFHGGVPADERPALIDRFHDDPDCRVFLPTDAGGVGLNLQHAAATVVNMDLPWNPAVLEQRIGRVYRLGQRKSVQVVNFVAQGSINPWAALVDAGLGLVQALTPRGADGLGGLAHRSSATRRAGATSSSCLCRSRKLCSGWPRRSAVCWPHGEARNDAGRCAALRLAFATACDLKPRGPARRFSDRAARRVRARRQARAIACRSSTGVCHC
jgi:SNF2 family DNA or RNA helicase